MQNLPFVIYVFLLISAFLSLACCITALVNYVKHYQPLNKAPNNFIFFMFLSNIISMATLIANLFFCKQSSNTPTNPLLNLLSGYLYLAFNQTFLSWLLILIFVEFFILTTPQKNFTQTLNASSKQFLCSSFLLPGFIGLPSFIIGLAEIQHDSYEDTYCFATLHSGVSNCLTLFIPTFCILFAILVFEYFLIKWVKQYHLLIHDPIYKQFRFEILLVSIYLVVVLGPILLIELIYSFYQASYLNYLYQFLLMFLNCLGLICFYKYGINPTLLQLVIWKINFFEEITSDKIATHWSSTSKTFTLTQTKQISLNRTTSNKNSSYKSLFRNTTQTQQSSNEKQSDFYKSFNGVQA